jgi:hypothetical protein
MLWETVAYLENLFDHVLGATVGVRDALTCIGEQPCECAQWVQLMQTTGLTGWRVFSDRDLGSPIDLQL